MATTSAGPVSARRACGLGHRKGRITSGFDADILAVEGNPLEDLTAIRRPRAVYVGGRAVLSAPGLIEGTTM